MKFAQFIKTMGTVTALCLIYIHMQMQIFDLAYQGKVKEQKIRKLNEDNGNATYSILKLKSAHNLGDQLLSENSGMQFLDESRIVKLEAPGAPAQQPVVLSAVSSRKTNPVLSFFSLRSQAEAKPQE